jgi:hypothetical protein
LKIESVLWAYKTTCKKLARQTPFKLVYGQESMVPLEFMVPSLDVEAITIMIERGTIHERLSQLMEMEEDMILVEFHQEVQKERNKYWDDKHIKNKIFKEGYLDLLYDNNFFQHLGKFRMHWGHIK